MLDATFDDLSPKFPDLTRDDVTQLFTDYGKVTYAPDPNSTGGFLARVKELERIGQKIADLEAKRQPKLTGKVNPNVDKTPEVIAEEADLRTARREFNKLYKEAEPLADPGDLRVLNGLRQPSLLIAPGERADLIVDFRAVPAGSILILYSDAPAKVIPAFRAAA